MNNREKEAAQYCLDNEKAVIAELKAIYSQAYDDIGEKIKALMADELTQSKIYQIEYQKALKGQVSAILDSMNSNQYDSISEYLRECYEDGFIGTLYSLHGYGIPLIIPINQEQVVNALILDSKISEKLYTKLGNNVKELKKTISHEISRGISTSMSYHDIARNLRSRGKMTENQSINIVQTEGHRIQNRSALDAGMKSREKGADLVKVWDSTLDSKTRPHHRALDGQVRELEEDFEIDGLTADSPGQFGIPSEDCRCRCFVLMKPRWDVDTPFTKRDNQSGELLEFENVKSYEEFKEKYWETVDKSSGSGIIKVDKKSLSKYIGKPIIETDNQHIREWYYANVTDISNQIDKSKPFEEQVKQAFNLRNKYKHEARVAMSDEETAKMLEKKRPVVTFDELLKDKMDRKHLTKEEALKDILETASKTNSDVNKEFGL